MKIIVLILCLLAIGCSTTPSGSVSFGNTGSAAYWGAVAQERREGIRKLHVGMTREEVEKMLPNPFLVEALGDGREYLLYVTNSPQKGEITSNNLTPVAFENGKVIGWGRNFFVNKERKYDIKVR